MKKTIIHIVFLIGITLSASSQQVESLYDSPSYAEPNTYYKDLYNDLDPFVGTWMKACRGSGVLEKEGKTWKIKHYVLSMTVPNDATKEVLPLKAKYEDALIEKMKKQ